MSFFQERMQKLNQKEEGRQRVKANIQVFLNGQWRENDYVLVHDLMWALADGCEHTRDGHIIPVITDAVINDKLTLWDSPIEKQCKLNALVQLKQTLPNKALISKIEFLKWQRKTNTVPLPLNIIDLANCEVIEDVPDIEKLTAENEMLKAKVAELEKRLYEFKELPTQTKNKVMPVVYGLCCLYFNKGHPLSKSRSNCEAIASELTTKFGIEIGDKGLENYYEAGRKILEV